MRTGRVVSRVRGVKLAAKTRSQNFRSQNTTPVKSKREGSLCVARPTRRRVSPPTSKPNTSKSPSAATSRAMRRAGPPSSASGRPRRSLSANPWSSWRRTCREPRSDSAPPNTSEVASGDGVLDRSTCMPLPRSTDEDLCALGLPPMARVGATADASSASTASVVTVFVRGIFASHRNGRPRRVWRVRRGRTPPRALGHCARFGASRSFAFCQPSSDSRGGAMHPRSLVGRARVEPAASAHRTSQGHPTATKNHPRGRRKFTPPRRR